MTNEYHKVACCVGGRGTLQSGKSAVPLRPGATARVRPGTPHRFVDDPDAPLRIAVLCLSDKAARALPYGAWSHLTKTLVPGRVKWLKATALTQVRQLVQQLSVASDGAGGNLRVAGLAVMTIGVILDGLSSRVPDRTWDGPDVTATLAWIDQHFASPIRVADLAAQAGLSYRSFTDRFKRQTGTTVVSYVNRRRVQLAVACLRASGDILGSAMEAGFGDLSHFYRVFREHTGMTPRRYCMRLTAGGG
jgi:AraC-like DNA-binding protein